jgi:hypothetical protein
MEEWRYSSTILDLTLDGGEWSASCFCCFIPREAILDTHCTGGWMGCSAGVDIIEKRKISFPYWE